MVTYLILAEWRALDRLVPGGGLNGRKEKNRNGLNRVEDILPRVELRLRLAGVGSTTHAPAGYHEGEMSSATASGSLSEHVQGTGGLAPEERIGVSRYDLAVATISFNVVDKQHARLLQHIADAWDLRQAIQVPHVVSPDAIARAGQEMIEDSETAAQRALDEELRDWLVVRRGSTWWQSPEGYLSQVEMARVDWTRMHLLDRADLRNQAEQVLAADPPTVIQFVVRAEALVLPAFEEGHRFA